MNLPCPDCGAALSAESYGGVEVDDCKACGGVWLDSGELKSLLADPVALQSVESDNNPVPQRTISPNPNRLCPKCGVPLESFRYAYQTTVILDNCPQCGGIWAQDGELSRIQEYLRHEKRPLSERETAAAGAAESIVEHKEFVDRQGRLADFFNFLRNPTLWRPLR